MLSWETGDINDQRRRIRELEEKVEGLRMSRRILMNILDLLEKTKKEEISRLEAENHRLQKANQKYARMILEKNREILFLQNQLLKTTPQKDNQQPETKAASGTD
ncbi:MAG TPA: translation initiation factor 2 [Clostridia bacterium]|jgi:predicted RNase H-like nuclease (RuvC/YqgF family)|nr:translation initiation factor 2 [Clostridia bacterium]